MGTVDIISSALCAVESIAEVCRNEKKGCNYWHRSSNSFGIRY